MADNLFGKYIWEVNTIRRAKRISLRDLQSKWSDSDISMGSRLSRKTFYNHCLKISELFGIIIKCDKSTNEYYIVETGRYEDDRIRKWLISNFSVSNMLNEARNMQDRVQLEDIPSGDIYLTEILEAIKESVVINIWYQSYSHTEPNTYLLQPYFLKLFKRRWYITARIINKNNATIRKQMIHTFALDRIKSLALTNRKFSYPKDFDPATYYSDVIGVYKSDKSAERITLRVSAQERAYFRSLVIHDSQREIETTPDYSLFEYRLCPTYDFKQALLSYGAEVDVVEPQWLRQEMRETIQQMMHRYSDAK